MGAAFGAGASGTVFGARGSASFLTKLTTWLGVTFFAISLSMAVIAARTGGVTEAADDLGVVEGLETAPSAEILEEGAQDEDFLPLPDESTEPPAPEETSVQETPGEPPPD